MRKKYKAYVKHYLQILELQSNLKKYETQTETLSKQVEHLKENITADLKSAVTDEINKMQDAQKQSNEVCLRPSVTCCSTFLSLTVE